MRLQRILAGIGRGVRRLVALLARPVTSAADREGFALQAYRGYGSRRQIFMLGRVFRQPGTVMGAADNPLGRDVRDIVRRILRRGAAGAELVARFHGHEQRLRTDRDGYFRVDMHLPGPVPADRLWHRIELELVAPAPIRAEGEIFIPPDLCRFVVVSDIDDTVIHTDVANKLVMLWRFVRRGARDATAFPGVASFYRALHAGRSVAASGGTGEANPLLYVSRSPWAIYELLDELFNANGIPVGPILFLREWGVTKRRPFPRRARAHKSTLIRKMLQLYDPLPFILIGDSGEADPEIYAAIVREFKERVLAVYIRDVGRRSGSLDAMERLAQALASVGSTLLVAGDSAAMASHAAGLGLIAPEATVAVARERAEAADGGAAAGQPAELPAPLLVSPAELRAALAEMRAVQAPLLVTRPPVEPGRLP